MRQNLNRFLQRRQTKNTLRQRQRQRLRLRQKQKQTSMQTRVRTRVQTRTQKKRQVQTTRQRQLHNNPPKQSRNPRRLKISYPTRKATPAHPQPQKTLQKTRPNRSLRRQLKKSRRDHPSHPLIHTPRIRTQRSPNCGSCSSNSLWKAVTC